MIRIGKKEENVQYTKRPGAYVIVESKEDSKIAIETNRVSGDWYLIGGGIENGETEQEALIREVLEETGYSLKNIRYFDKVSAWANGKSRGPLDITATVYIAEFNEKVAEPIEKEDKVCWVNANEYKDRLFHEYQRYILEEYIKLKEKSLYV